MSWSPTSYSLSFIRIFTRFPAIVIGTLDALNTLVQYFTQLIRHSQALAPLLQTAEGDGAMENPHEAEQAVLLERIIRNVVSGIVLSWTRDVLMQRCRINATKLSSR